MNVRDFYAEDPRRQESPETAFGDEWRAAEDPTALYAVHWIEQTHEIYTFRQPQPPFLTGFDPRLAMTFTLPLNDDALRVELLGWAEARQAIEAALDDWEAHMADPNSLQWVRDRLEEAARATLRERRGTATLGRDPDK